MKRFVIFVVTLVTAVILVRLNKQEASSYVGQTFQAFHAPDFYNIEGREIFRKLPNDPHLSTNYGLVNNGSGSDVKILQAWRINYSCKPVIIAIIDTGVDRNHPDLKANLWRNRGETGFDSKGRRREANGIDDDKNGYIDDVFGWDFVDNDNNPEDSHGHGTHVAGIVGAVGGNGIGTSGVCANAKLMILKYYSARATGKQNLRNSVRALRYAIRMRAKVINYSGGGSYSSGDERNALKLAERLGIIVVAAAGNGRSNTDWSSYYPASYDLNNIITVAATNYRGELAKTSNYGPRTVDIAAPGEQIYSTLPGGRYGKMTGTSQATPFVTGAVALLLATYPSLTPAEVKWSLLKSTDPLPARDRKKVLTGGKLNIYRALLVSSSNKTYVIRSQATAKKKSKAKTVTAKWFRKKR